VKVEKQIEKGGFVKPEWFSTYLLSSWDWTEVLLGQSVVVLSSLINFSYDFSLNVNILELSTDHAS